MSQRLRRLSALIEIALFAALLFGGVASFAQDSGVNLSLHANSHADRKSVV